MVCWVWLLPLLFYCTASGVWFVIDCVDFVVVGVLVVLYCLVPDRVWVRSCRLLLWCLSLRVGWFGL